jgi:hypothetical protein
MLTSTFGLLSKPVSPDVESKDSVIPTLLLKESMLLIILGRNLINKQ